MDRTPKCMQIILRGIEEVWLKCENLIENLSRIEQESLEVEVSLLLW